MRRPVWNAATTLIQRAVAVPTSFTFLQFGCSTEKAAIQKTVFGMEIAQWTTSQFHASPLGLGQLQPGT